MSNSEGDSSSRTTPPAHAPASTSAIPLPPETLLDLVQALGGLTSESPAQREFAEKIRKAYFDDLPAQCASDGGATGYLREVLAATASTLRGFAVERTAFRKARAREEKLDELRGRITADKFFHSPVESERWTKLYGAAAKLLLPVAGTAAIIRGWEQLSWQAVFGAALLAGLWIFFGDLLLTALIVLLQVWLYRTAGDPRKDVHSLWASSLASYKELSVQLLVSAERARERWFPASTGLIAPLRWSDIPPCDLCSFLVTPNARLAAKSPAEILSRLVDLHFGVQPGKDALYVVRSAPVVVAGRTDAQPRADPSRKRKSRDTDALAKDEH